MEPTMKSRMQRQFESQIQSEHEDSCCLELAISHTDMSSQEILISKSSVLDELQRPMSNSSSILIKDRNTSPSSDALMKIPHTILIEFRNFQQALFHIIVNVFTQTVLEEVRILSQISMILEYLYISC